MADDSELAAVKEDISDGLGPFVAEPAAVAALPPQLSSNRNVGANDSKDSDKNNNSSKNNNKKNNSKNNKIRPEQRTITARPNDADACSDLTDNAEEVEEANKSFPQRLMDILSDDTHEDIISWLPHGTGFQIHKKKTFAAEILPRFFKASKFTSFTRKLNRWGFTRVPRGPETGAYFHKLFRRDKPELCLQMTSNSGNKYQANPMQQSLLPSMPGMMSPMPGMPTPIFAPFMNPMMAVAAAGMTPQQQMQQQAIWQQQMQQMMMYQQHHMMQMQQGMAAQHHMSSVKQQEDMNAAFMASMAGHGSKEDGGDGTPSQSHHHNHHHNNNHESDSKDDEGEEI